MLNRKQGRTAPISAFDLGIETNRAFQRLIHLLSDQNRMQTLALNQNLITRKQGRTCLLLAPKVLTERQQAIVNQKVLELEAFFERRNTKNKHQ